MNVDPLLIKIGELVLLQQAIGIVKETSTRWVIKNWFSNSEITAMSWFTAEFFNTLTPLKILGLGVIAAFTLVTFPLGIWIGSFKLGLSIPVSSIISAGIFIFTCPVNFFVVNKIVGEMALNENTLVGLLFIEGAQVLAIIGWWMVYGANRVGV